MQNPAFLVSAYSKGLNANELPRAGSLALGFFLCEEEARRQEKSGSCLPL